MRVLIVGGGGREHAIAWKVAQSPKLTQLYCLPGNPGIAEIATCLPGSANDIAAVVAAVEANDIDLTIVGPEEPLCLGLADALRQRGRQVFGPTAAAAAIEGSKAFAKQLMLKHGIPTASYQVFEELKPALAFLGSCPLPVVIKADGIAAGKGVIIATQREEALAAARDMLSGSGFGSAGRRIVVEEFLSGPEVSVLALCDGNDFALLPPAQDHKRALEGDRGPNTGGMGTYSPLPFCPPSLLTEIGERVVRPALAALRDAGRPFTGVLFAGLILTAAGPKVLEFNCRFGDPETQTVLRRLKSDLLDGIEACLNGTVAAWRPEIDPQAACCIVLASGGYPGAYRRGVAIEGLSAAAELPDVVVFHAGTSKLGQRTVTAGGRVLGVTATGESLEAALARAYQAVDVIGFDGKQFRRDIGHQARNGA
jgi:phosphoribosylamine--glycine ligase